MNKSVIYRYISRGGRYYPVIPVVLKAMSELIAYAVVDSGATISLFHNQVAESIGLDLSRGEVVYLSGIGGYVKGILIDNVTIEIPELGYETNIPIAFTEYISSDLAILGRQGFFELFEITFREWMRELELKLRS